MTDEAGARLRLTVIQMNPGADKSANIAAAGRLIEGAMADHPQLVVLPEIWTCLGGGRATKFAAAEILPPPATNTPGGAAYEFLRATARTHRIHVHGGSIGEIDPAHPDRLFNTTLVFDPAGTEIARYRKIHLFDITTPDGQAFAESATYAAGSTVVTCRVGDLTMGLAICYDLRFAELFLALRRAGADLIVLPAAFTVQTGRDHWEPLLRARAIETQCWFVAPATVGRHVELARAGPSERHTYGHSLIADPWGHIVTRASPMGPAGPAPRLDPRRSPTADPPRHAGVGTPPAAGRHHAPCPRERHAAIELATRSGAAEHWLEPDRIMPSPAAPTDLAQESFAPPGQPLRQRERSGRRKRWCAWAATASCWKPCTSLLGSFQTPGLRHELRLGRFPDERLQRGRHPPPPGRSAGGGDAPAAHAHRDDDRRGG